MFNTDHMPASLLKAYVEGDILMHDHVSTVEYRAMRGVTDGRWRLTPEVRHMISRTEVGRTFDCRTTYVCWIKGYVDELWPEYRKRIQCAIPSPAALLWVLCNVLSNSEAYPESELMWIADEDIPENFDPEQPNLYNIPEIFFLP